MDFFESFEKYVLPELQAEEEMRKQPLSEELFDIEETPGEKTKIEVPPVQETTINEEAMVEKIAAKVAEMLAKKGEE